MIAAEFQNQKDYFDSILEQTGDLPILTFDEEQALFKEIESLRKQLLSRRNVQEWSIG